MRCVEGVEAKLWVFQTSALNFRQWTAASGELQYSIALASTHQIIYRRTHRKGREITPRVGKYTTVCRKFFGSAINSTLAVQSATSAHRFHQKKIPNKEVPQMDTGKTSKQVTIAYFPIYIYIYIYIYTIHDNLFYTSPEFWILALCTGHFRLNVLHYIDL
jgi:hypothetical protein